jgi:hypothetical protein
MDTKPERGFLTSRSIALRVAEIHKKEDGAAKGKLFRALQEGGGSVCESNTPETSRRCLSPVLKNTAGNPTGNEKL